MDIAWVISDRPPETSDVERVGLGKVLFINSTNIFRVIGVAHGSLLGVVPVEDTVNHTAIVVAVVTRLGVRKVSHLEGVESHMDNTVVVDSDGTIHGHE